MCSIKSMHFTASTTTTTTMRPISGISMNFDNNQCQPSKQTGLFSIPRMIFYYLSADVPIQMKTFQNCAQLFGFKIDGGVEVVISKRMFCDRCIHYMHPTSSTPLQKPLFKLDKNFFFSHFYHLFCL